MNISRKLNEDLNKIAFPLLIQSISAILIGIIDQAMIGRTSIEGYGAVGIVNSTLYVITGVLGILSVTFNIMASRQKNFDKDDVQKLFSDFISLGLLLSVFTYVTIFIFKDIIFKVMYGLNGQILDIAKVYFTIYGFSIVLNTMIFIVSTNFKIYKKTKYILIFSIIANIANVFLNYILIFGKLGLPKLGVTGAAIASILATIIQLILLLIFSKAILNIKMGFSFRVYKYSEIIKKSFPILVQDLMDGMILILLINSFIGRLSVSEIGTYSLINSIISVSIMPGYIYGSSVMTLVGQYFHNKNFINCHHIIRQALKNSLLIIIVILLIAYFKPMFIVKIITDETNLIELSSKIIFWALLFQVVRIPQEIYKNALQTMDESNYVLKHTFISNSVCVILIMSFFILNQRNIMVVYISLFINYFIQYFYFRRKCKSKMKILNKI